jgi:penicillin G amidase
MRPVITYDAAGTPGLWATDARAAYGGIGYLHARHRPLPALLLHAAARGRVAELVVGRDDLVRLDALVHRLDLVRRGEAEAPRLSQRTAAFVDAYLEGFRDGLRDGGMPFELNLLATRLPLPDRKSLLSGLMLSAFLGLAEGQERMERALIEALAAGADEKLIARMFAPGFPAASVASLPRRAPLGFSAHGLPIGAFGSNAWAVSPARSASGASLFACDPHLQVDQLPALLFELRARVGDDVWLGATIPGLPGIAVGRTRRLAWGGTFSVADNTDFAIEEVKAGKLVRGGVATGALVTREVEVRRRGRQPLTLRFFSGERGELERDTLVDGPALAVRWAGSHAPAQALGAYLDLPLAQSAAEAETMLQRAHAFSLHFVLADRGEVRYRQTGCVPKRTAGWSGLFPARDEAERWLAFYESGDLPHEATRDGVVATANEGRQARDGRPLSPLAQPPYRRERILELLSAGQRHDAGSMKAIQLDLISSQGRRLAPRLRDLLPDGPLRAALAAWDFSCDTDSTGAHAFAVAHRAALGALAPELGGDWFSHMLAESELPVWWCAALDGILASPDVQEGARGQRLRRALAGIGPTSPRRWGEVQRFSLRHMVLGGLSGLLGLDRGPFELPGQIGTVRQGNVYPVHGREVAIGPAYRFVCDLGSDDAFASLPGGVDGSRLSRTYDRWLAEWRAGDYHRLAAPADGERALKVPA